MWEAVAVGLAGAAGGFTNILIQIVEDKDRTWRTIVPTVVEVATIGIGTSAGLVFWAINNGGLSFDTDAITAGHIGGALLAGITGGAYFRQLLATRTAAANTQMVAGAYDDLAALQEATPGGQDGNDRGNPRP